MKSVYLGGGCFWGLEELFRDQPGVIDTEAVYVNGGTETLEITYDETQTNLKKLLDYFFRIHDPTTKNQQGNDIGEQYRSVIFYKNDTEKKIADDFIALVNNNGAWGAPVTTTVEKIDYMTEAEDFLQDYLQKNPGGYTCHYVRPMESFLEKNN